MTHNPEESVKTRVGKRRDMLVSSGEANQRKVSTTDIIQATQCSLRLNDSAPHLRRQKVTDEGQQSIRS
ncbi:hypothetical protein EYF80_042324 [Liparis tanakae]|uniref:Uncharacterized protein n=1 Tax=Liparis tanakae TaxID=230148 RepID=A0A4Z2G1P3_9TELE|nr:hypothetical protein EYF80_042324 [Liparis tanakae]